MEPRMLRPGRRLVVRASVMRRSVIDTVCHFGVLLSGAAVRRQRTRHCRRARVQKDRDNRNPRCAALGPIRHHDFSLTA